MEPILYYILAAVVGHLAPRLIEWLRAKAGGAAPSLPSPASPPSPLPPMPDGKGSLLLWLLQLLGQARLDPKALSEEEKAVARVVWDATPDDRPSK